MKSPLQLVIARDIITSQITAYLYSIKALPEHVEVIHIEFGDLTKNLPGKNEVDKEIIPIKVHLRTEELEVTYFDTDATSQSPERS